MITPAAVSGAVSGAIMATSATATTSVSGADMMASGIASPDFMLGQPTIIKADVAFWAKVVKDAGITAD